ncbi:hypothetical protein G7Z17_g13413 [Cylindrodendrum hubeiense]|uniref:Uncharacterized protein n=1 Tax=Cylindrodendrum hubeiense TaxID=595255 RepID=A0A9P5GX40_9HYPO|nr:hypothetical protein G7Z17_g13413 [Cylindrodendrum hubeiense]
MANDRTSNNSLEKELANEDIVVAAGFSSKLKRKQNKDKKMADEEEKESKRQFDLKTAMLAAGTSSRSRRKPKGDN